MKRLKVDPYADVRPAPRFAVGDRVTALPIRDVLTVTNVRPYAQTWDYELSYFGRVVFWTPEPRLSPASERTVAA